MVGVEKHLQNMASSQVIKPPTFKVLQEPQVTTVQQGWRGGGGGQI